MNKGKRMAMTLALIAAATFHMQAAETAVFAIKGHLKDPSIIHGDDEMYYLTGTSNINTLDPRYADFQNNDGVRLWKSKDLKTWEDAGLVWNLAADPNKGLRGDGIIMRHMRPDRDQERDETWQHGITDVSLQRVGDVWTIVCSMNGYGVCILKSDAGPAGPFKQVFQLSRSLFPRHGRLFVNQDGVIYLIWTDGLIVPMKGDLSGLAGEPRQLRFATKDGATIALPSGAGHVALARHGDRYVAVFSGWDIEKGEGCRAIYVATGASLDEPFSLPERLEFSDSRPDIFVSVDGELLLTTSKDSRPVIRSIAFDDSHPQLKPLAK